MRDDILLVPRKRELLPLVMNESTAPRSVSVRVQPEPVEIFDP